MVAITTDCGYNSISIYRYTIIAVKGGELYDEIKQSG